MCEAVYPILSDKVGNYKMRLWGAVEGTRAAPPPTASTVALDNKTEAKGNVTADTLLLQHQQTRDGNLPGSGNPINSIEVSFFVSGLFL